MLIAAAVAIALVSQAPASDASSACEQLTSLTLPNTTITIAETVAAGAFVPPVVTGGAAPPAAAAFAELPSFCRVAATLKPSTDSDIKIEVWLPKTGWNG